MYIKSYYKSHKPSSLIHQLHVVIDSQDYVKGLEYLQVIIMHSYFPQMIFNCFTRIF